jgi:hypothetical protein
LVFVSTPLMVLAMLDPLEGGILIAVLGVFVAVASKKLNSRGRGTVVSGLLLFAATFAVMTVAADRATIIQNLTLIPWIAAALLTIAGATMALRDALAATRASLANAVALMLAVTALGLTLRVLVVLGDYRPRDVRLIEQASVTRPDVRLALELESTRFVTDLGYGSAAVLRNTGAQPIDIPPGTMMNVVMKRPSGEKVWDAVERYYGPVPKSFPWDTPLTVPVGESTRREWMVACPGEGTFYVSAEVNGSPFDGLRTSDRGRRCTPSQPEA